MKIAVIGAGIAGLQVARELRSRGADVHVFDKARGPSGRLATRRTDSGNFDHGAQYFTARSPSFIAQVEEWCRRGVAEQWEAKVVTLEAGKVGAEANPPKRFVGAPRMSALARDLANGIPTQFSARVEAVNRMGSAWTLEFESSDEPSAEFDTVLVAVPAPQAAPLLQEAPDLAQLASAARFLPCHALMVRFDAELDVDFDAAFVRSSPLSWISRDASKPGRESAPCWVLHSSAEWSEAQLETSHVEVQDILLAALTDAVGQKLPAVEFSSVHRWLYARSNAPTGGSPSLWDPEKGLGACGDWTVGDRVEDAFLSAERLVEQISNAPMN